MDVHKRVKEDAPVGGDPHAEIAMLGLDGLALRAASESPREHDRDSEITMVEDLSGVQQILVMEES